MSTTMPTGLAAGAVRFTAEIKGLDFAMLKGNVSNQDAVVGAVESGIKIAMALMEPPWPVAAADFHSTLQHVRHLQGVTRALQASGAVSVVTEVATLDAAATGDLSSALREAQDQLSQEVTKSLEALPNIGLLVHPGALLEAVVSVGVLEPSEEEQAAALEAVAESLTIALLAEFRGNATSVTKQLPNGAVATVTRLRSDAGGGSSMVTVDDPVAQVEVSMPRSLFAGLAPPGEDLFLSVVANAKGVSAKSENLEDKKIAAVVSISLRLLSGSKLKVDGLSEPVKFSMPTNFSLGMECAYWDADEGAWSQKGMAGSASNVPGSPITCETRHFTLFGAIFQGFVQTLACAKRALSLFQLDGLANLATGSWYTMKGALWYWCFLGIMVVIMARAIILDMRRDSYICWNNEFFLVPVQHTVQPASVTEDTEEHAPGDAPHSQATSLHGGHSTRTESHRGLYIIGGCCTCMTCCSNDIKNQVKDVMDELCSEWFEAFAEMRGLLMEIMNDVSMGNAGLLHMSHSAMTALVIGCSIRLTASSLGLSYEVVDFLLKDEDLTPILMDRHDRLSGIPGEEIIPTREWWLCTERDEAWAKLLLDVSESMQEHVKYNWRNVPCMMWQVFMVDSPIGMTSSLDLFMSCKMRALFYMMESTCTMMVVSVFYSTAGSVRGRGGVGDSGGDGCGDETFEGNMAYNLGRALATVVGSAILAGLPAGFIRSLHIVRFKKMDREGSAAWKQQLLTWQRRDRMIWLLGSFYVALSVFVTSLFLANVAEEDLEDWTMTMQMHLAWELVLTPVGKALLIPTLAGVLLSLNARLRKAQRGHMIRDVQHRLLNQTNMMLPLMSV